MNTIRRAKPSDVDGILKLLVQVNMVHHNGRPDLFKGPTTKYSGEELRKIIADETTPVFVSVDERNRILGHAFCVVKETRGDRLLMDIKTLYIDDICVEEEARGQGVGAALYHSVLDYARAIECYNVTLNVWTCNPGAIAFYEKLGLKAQKIGMEVIL
ncbi:MAG: GNAT family N-acetyltransferase [Thermoguttaceae bacterium]|nr:GNAT family N-acetyltransferase [Thermoguttaceae bacterium]